MIRMRTYTTKFSMRETNRGNMSRIKKLGTTIVFVLLLLSSASLQAKVKMPGILDDNMVLQQKSAAKIWGLAKENTKIKVTTSWDK